MGDVTLVLGGIKCGKTNYAQKIASERENNGDSVLYIATAEALDEEMVGRIEKHKKDRPDSWATIEEPFDIEGVISKDGNNYDVILLDCLTLWITNRLVKAGENYDREEFISSVLKDCSSFLKEISMKKCDIYIISNQVELGLVSPYPMGRVFQDLAGLLHQKIAKEAKNVVVLQAGIPLALKGEI